MFSMLFIMLKVKFVVLLICIASCSSISKYCKICLDHVLCKYPIPGPSESCKEYDKDTFLTDDDINDLVNQINERRNFIAMGHSKRLPRAANMKKVGWSDELATFAQRWVDQCDPSNKEDQCRDLDYGNVAQNIASILNPSSAFNVKSFIEMWFMQSLDYTGSVSYYQFQDQTSKYFTQLIWADTESVGCGRAKFVVNNAIVERIVCNFSPKGNIYGKPVYAIGFPGTQCLNGMAPDRAFPGLCTQQAELTTLPSPNLPVSSLLRILNLSNDSVKHEIDPLYNNIKQIHRNLKEIESPRHQIMRHILRNKIQSRKSDSPYRELNFWERPINVSRNHLGNGRERGHSRLHHNHAFRFDDQPTTSGLVVDDRKYSLGISPLNLNSQNNYRKNYFNKQCTRSTESQENDCNHSSKNTFNQYVNECTRGLITSCKMITQGTMTIPALINNHVVPQELCPCSTHRTTYPTTITSNQHHLYCECENGVTIHCPNLSKTLENNEKNQKNSADIYDNLYPTPNENNNWPLKIGQKREPYSKRSQSVQSNRNIKKREFRDISTIKPFWQIDNFNDERDTHLKALRYTSLPRRQRPKAKKHRFKTFSTESITIKSKKSDFDHVTEKYLSFDELLHLRNSNFNGYGARRQNKPDNQTVKTITTQKTEPTKLTQTTKSILTTKSALTTKLTQTTKSILTTKSAQTIVSNIERTTNKIGESTLEELSDYTANTPFIRMKHCTRRLTCTWTAASLTDNDGSIIPGAATYHGSRTPPGYVEGCTRTSTCTRDYMDRNIFPTLTTETSVATTDEDESDYCERRSLNVQKRNSNRDKRYLLFDRKTFNKESRRKKRGRNIDHSECESHTKNKYPATDMSYGDLYYLVLRKIIEKWNNNRNRLSNSPCRCSKGIISQKFCILGFVFLFINI